MSGDLTGLKVISRSIFWAIFNCSQSVSIPSDFFYRLIDWFKVEIELAVHEHISRAPLFFTQSDTASVNSIHSGKKNSFNNCFNIFFLSLVFFLFAICQVQMDYFSLLLVNSRNHFCWLSTISLACLLAYTYIVHEHLKFS